MNVFRADSPLQSILTVQNAIDLYRDAEKYSEELEELMEYEGETTLNSMDRF